MYGHSKLSSDGFRGVLEWFWRGLKPCGFRVVSESLKPRGVVSEWFQRGLKLCGFRVVSEESESAWFQSGFRGSETVWF